MVHKLTAGLFGYILKIMRITKCDICKKNISGEPVMAGASYFRNKEFCGKCGRPVLDFLIKHKFVEKEKITPKATNKKLTK